MAIADSHKHPASAIPDTGAEGRIWLTKADAGLRSGAATPMPRREAPPKVHEYERIPASFLIREARSELGKAETARLSPPGRSGSAPMMNDSARLRIPIRCLARFPGVTAGSRRSRTLSYSPTGTPPRTCDMECLLTPR